jgi:hypothetical protein
MNSRFPLLDVADQETLFDALHYMKMDQLKEGCEKLTLSSKGKKKELIDRILTFIKTGQIVVCAKIPAKSIAKSYPEQLLKSDSYMLYGSYKNDAKTRAFFTSLIGPHFHFTAFGIDWLNDRWQQGLPPTYQEFADYWSKEMAWRKQHANAPKDEWAFIKFLQRMQRDEPNARQEDLMHAWKELQQKQAMTAEKLIEKAMQKL